MSVLINLFIVMEFLERVEIRVCFIPNGQKHHFSVLSNLHEKSPIDTDVCV